MNDWKTCPLGELIENLDACRMPVKEADRRPGPYPYYGASGVVDYVDSYLFDGLHLLIAEDGENLRTRKLPIAFLADDKFWVNNHAHIVRGNTRADTRFLCYAIQVADVTSYLTGSTMPKLTQGNLHRIPILTPPLVEQAAIAAILGALDDKIDLNRRMNETLEAMARAIFKDWFVDFGPTRAKMEGREPYLAPELWALFPDRLDDEGKPEGWETAELASVVSELRRGLSPKYVTEGGILVLNQKCIRNRVVSLAPARRHDIRVKSIVGRELHTGDILINSTGTGTLGRVAQLWTIKESIIADSHVTVVRANKSKVTALYLGMNLTSRESEIESLGEGSTGQTELSRARLGLLQILLPPATIQSSFDYTVGSMIDRIEANIQENIYLAQTRDLLLPKLMSGEIRVKEAEEIIEKVG